MSLPPQELHVDDKPEHGTHSHDTLMDDLCDTNFVDIHEFQYLVTHIVVLEDQIKNMTASH